MANPMGRQEQTELIEEIDNFSAYSVEKIQAEILSDKANYNLTTAKENMILRNIFKSSI